MALVSAAVVYILLPEAVAVVGALALGVGGVVLGIAVAGVVLMALLSGS